MSDKFESKGGCVHIQHGDFISLRTLPHDDTGTHVSLFVYDKTLDRGLTVFLSHDQLVTFAKIVVEVL